MTSAEQETLQTSVIYEAQTRLAAYLTKNANRVVTTEHIRRQKQDGTWYDKNTYQLPMFAQHTLRNVMTVVHEADSDGIHTIPATPKPTMTGGCTELPYRQNGEGARTNA